MLRYTLNYMEQMLAATGAVLPRYTVTLKEFINGSILREAVNAALAYHPHFRMRLVKINGLYCVVENAMSPVVREWDDGCDYVYGGSDCNNYPWVVAYNGKRIFFSAVRALTDFEGARGFLLSVIRQYLELRGKMFGTFIGLAASENLNRSMENIFLMNGNPSVTAFASPDLGDAFALEADFYKNCPEDSDVYRICLDLPDVRKFSLETSTTNLTTVAYVIARALERASGKKEGVIKIRLPVNVRGIFRSVSDRDCSVVSHLDYDIGCMGKLDRKTVETIFKGQLAILSDMSNAIEYCNEINAATDEILKHPDNLDEFAGVFRKKRGALVAEVSYCRESTAQSLGEIEQYMTNYEVIPVQDCPYFMEVVESVFDGRVCLNVCQGCRDDVLVRKMREILSEEGIGHTVEKIGKSGLLRPAASVFA